MITLRRLVIAAALGTGLAASHVATAQTPSAEPRPSGQPNAGDVRSLPDAKPGTTVGPTTPQSGSTQRQMNEERSKRNPAGDPNAGDTRATPGGDRTSQREKDLHTGRAKEETNPMGSRTGDVGTPEQRKDGPGAGIPQNPTRN